MMDVIVIGSGASGVAALRRLHDAGLKVLCLEAADRIGGRIHSVPHGEAMIDLGAGWCHGEKDNVVFELAYPLGLLDRPVPGQQWFVQSNGDLIPSDIGETLLKEIKEEVDRADKNNTLSISEYIRSAAITNKTLQKDPKLAQLFIEWYERNNHVGGYDDPRKGKSLKFVEECRVESESSLNWKGKGYKTILDILLNKYPDPSEAIPVQILLNKEVETIKWRANEPNSDPSNPLVHVKCKDGSLYAAKSVIVTVSVGVLKERHSELFNPPLPADKINTINHFQMSVVTKIYIEFSKPWWQTTPTSFIMLWNDEDKAKLAENEQWLSDIYVLLTVEQQPNLLLACIYGKGALEMEKLSLGEVKAGVEKLFAVLFKKFDVTPVKSVIRPQWMSNPLVRGIYAYRSVATEEEGGSAAILSQPLYNSDGFPVVCFAGEATAHHMHTAVHGAIEAGFREADRLTQHIKKLQII